MTFWQSFFNNKNQYRGSYYLNSNQLDQHKILLIENFQHHNKYINIYLSTSNNINLYDLEQLCDSVGWVRRPLKKVKIALENSFLIACIFSYDDSNENLIGFARATSDNSFNATIWDVVIHPKFQGKGLGKALMNQMIQQLRSYEITTITLFADPQVIKFYNHLGFIVDPDGVKGMFWYPI